MPPLLRKGAWPTNGLTVAGLQIGGFVNEA